MTDGERIGLELGGWRTQGAKALAVLRERRVWIPAVAGVALVAVVGGTAAGALGGHSDDASAAVPSSATAASAPPRATSTPEPGAAPSTTPTPEPTVSAAAPMPESDGDAEAEPVRFPFTWIAGEGVEGGVSIEADPGARHLLTPVFSPDGAHVMVTVNEPGGGADVSIFDALSGKVVASLPRSEYPAVAAWSPSGDGRAIAATAGDGDLVLWRLEPGTAIAHEVATIENAVPERLVTGSQGLYLTYRDPDPRAEVHGDAYVTVELTDAGKVVGPTQPYLAVHPTADGEGAFAWKATGAGTVQMVVLDSPDLESATVTAVEGMTYPDGVHSEPPTVVASPTGSGYLIEQPVDDFTWGVWHTTGLGEKPRLLANVGLGAEDLAFSDDGTMAIAIADAQARATLMLVDVATGTDLRAEDRAVYEGWDLTAAGFAPGDNGYIEHWANEDVVIAYVTLHPLSGGPAEWMPLHGLTRLTQHPVWAVGGDRLALAVIDDRGAPAVYFYFTQ